MTTGPFPVIHTTGGTARPRPCPRCGRPIPVRDAATVVDGRLAHARCHRAGQPIPAVVLVVVAACTVAHLAATTWWAVTR